MVWAFVKQVTSKPVVGGRPLHSPDPMVQRVRSGALDMIGATRPSIADPFLRRKIAEGRLDDIRECIGCNIDVSGDFTYSPIRCTQNPAMGEEWSKGWHPERIPGRKSLQKVLVVGEGPAGLECGRTRSVGAQSVVLVTARVPNDSLHEQLMAREADFAASGLRSRTRTGDCPAPSTIAAAVYAGHRFAHEFESEPNDDVPFLVERPSRA